MYNIGDWLRPSKGVATGSAPGNQSFSYGQVSANAPGKIKGTRYVNGELYYDVDQTSIGGGTGWLRASDLGGGGSNPGGSNNIFGGGYQPKKARSFQDILAEARKMLDEQKAPVISSLREQMPTIEAMYGKRGEQLEGRIAPFEEKYNNMLAEVTRMKDEEKVNTESAKRKEFAKRGIAMSSGMYGNELEKAITPIERYYGTRSTDLNLDRVAKVKEITDIIDMLPLQQKADIQKVLTTIANVEGASGESAINLAQKMLTNEQAQEASSWDRFLKQLDYVDSRSDNTWKQRLAENADARAERELNYKLSNPGGVDTSMLNYLLKEKQYNQYNETIDSLAQQYANGELKNITFESLDPEMQGQVIARAKQYKGTESDSGPGFWGNLGNWLSGILNE